MYIATKGDLFSFLIDLYFCWGAEGVNDIFNALQAYNVTGFEETV